MKAAVRSWLPAVALGVAGSWLGRLGLAYQEPWLRTDNQEHLLSQYIYSHVSPYTVPGASVDGKDLSNSLVKFTTEDSSEKVIAWYLGELGIVPEPGKTTNGIFEIGGDFNQKLWNRSVAEVRAFVHDYQVLEKTGAGGRLGVIWEASAEICASGGLTYVLTVLVTRVADEPRTHIALSWFPT